MISSSYISNNEKEFILKGLLEELRIDGRGLLDNRNIEVHFGLQPGHVEVHMGNTWISSKTYAEIIEPKPERPNEGFLKFKVDLSVLSEEQQSSTSKQYATQITKLLEKIIKGSKALDVESLCLVSGKRVWSILVQSMLINNDGNLIDAIYLSTIVSMLNFQKQQVSVESSDKIKIFTAEEKSLTPLSINHIPLAFTFVLFNQSQSITIDPTEEVMDGRITVALNVYKDISLVHKPGGAPVKPEILGQDIVQESLNHSVLQIKEDGQVLVTQFQQFDITESNTNKVDLQQLEEEMMKRSEI